MWGSTERKILVLRPSLRRPEEEALAEVDWVVGYSWRHSEVALMLDWVWIGLPSKRISVLFMQGTHQVRDNQTQIGGPSLMDGKGQDTGTPEGL